MERCREGGIQRERFEGLLEGICTVLLACFPSERRGACGFRGSHEDLEPFRFALIVDSDGQSLSHRRRRNYNWHTLIIKLFRQPCCQANDVTLQNASLKHLQDTGSYGRPDLFLPDYEPVTSGNL
jgi:hypothetical protein